MARKDNDPEKKPFVRRVYILLAILLGLLLPFVLVVPSMVEEHARRNQLLKNVPKEGLIQGLSKSLFGDSSWEKTDLNRIVGVELREDETTMCGFACMKYWNNRNVPTKFDDLRFYVFKKQIKRCYTYRITRIIKYNCFWYFYHGCCNDYAFKKWADKH